LDISIDVELLAVPPAELTSNTERKDWEGFISSWTLVDAKEGACSWVKGDLVSELLVTFGNEKGPDGDTPLEKFAVDIGVRSRTLKQYAWVSQTFPSRGDRMFENLSWSHFRACVAAENPMSWIEKASQDGWSVARLTEEIKNATDNQAVTDGIPCTYCQGMLPESGSLHLRRDNHTVGSYCSWKCLLAFGLIQCKEEDAAESC
jgi:hypothetical protein